MRPFSLATRPIVRAIPIAVALAVVVAPDPAPAQAPPRQAASERAGAVPGERTATPHRLRADQPATVHGGPPTAQGLAGPGEAARAEAAAPLDTLWVLGGPGAWDGRFETPDGQPSWHGWTHRDLTAADGQYWQVSDFQAIDGAYSLWCGTYFGDDPGYGNGWDQRVVFTSTAADAGGPSTVRWALALQLDTEPGYDYVHLQWNRAGTWVDLGGSPYDGDRHVAFDATWTIWPGEYAGPGGDEIQLRIRFVSDGAWSDEDGLWLTDGACQVDDVLVAIDGVPEDLEDFEDQDPGRWEVATPLGVGDFAQLWTGLDDLDPCRDNPSPQVAFIDDGEVVPGTGGTTCYDWCYGPGGYILNWNGGLLGPDYDLDNVIESPVLDWPAGCEDGLFAFDVYQHEELDGDSSYMFYTWGVRATADPAGDPLAQKAYVTPGIVFYGPPDYLRKTVTLAPYLPPGAVQVQVRLELWQAPIWDWGWHGDGTPAPYFDNVAVAAYPIAGPVLAADTVHLAQDAFPASGEVDRQDLAANSVRFDMAASIAPQQHLRNDPGDSIVVTAASRAAGAELAGPPAMHVRLRANPLFAGVRVLPPGFTQSGDLVTGTVPGDTVVDANGQVVADRWAFDLPDTGFFFPGDVLHYLVRAEESLGGQLRVACLPADTAGFCRFDANTPFDARFVVRALPTLHSAEPGGQPDVLVWYDGGDLAARMRWHHALLAIALQPRVEFDVYESLAPSAGVGNGLGGRATAAQLAGYDVLLYTSGDLQANTLGWGDPGHDPSRDVQVLTDWFAQGDKRALFSGDHLVSSLASGPPALAAFLDAYLRVGAVSDDLAPLIGGQVAPEAEPVAGGFLEDPASWRIHDGCPDLATSDAVEVWPGALRLAEFRDPSGAPGTYPLAAAWYAVNASESVHVVGLPYDLARVRAAADQEWSPPYRQAPVRASLLSGLLDVLGVPVWWPPIAAPGPAAPLALAARPNPFNPTTTLVLDLPRGGHADVAIFDLRGLRVRTLHAGDLAAGRHDLRWDGRDHAGSAVASGVYFAEAVAAGERSLVKLTLVR